MSAGVVAEHPSVTKDAMYAGTAKRELPTHRVGRLGNFRVTEVDDGVRYSSGLERTKPSKKEAR